MTASVFQKSEPALFVSVLDRACLERKQSYDHGKLIMTYIWLGVFVEHVQYIWNNGWCFAHNLFITFHLYGENNISMTTCLQPLPKNLAVYIFESRWSRIFIKTISFGLRQKAGLLNDSTKNLFFVEC